MYHHVHVSEVPDSPVVECTTASVLEVVRAVLNGDPRQPPASPAEREALRQASGAPDNAGASLDDLQRGVSARYGLSLPVGPMPDLASLPDGTFLAVQGNMHVVTDRLKKWDTAFGARPVAAHCVCVYRLAGKLMWCDPLAPWYAYTGEPVAAETVYRYFQALPGARVMRGQLHSTEDQMLPAEPDGAATPWDQLVDLAPSTVITATDGSRITLVSGGSGVWSPFASSPTQRAVRFTTGGVAQIGTVPLSSCSNMRPRVIESAAYNNGLSAAAAAVAAIPRK